MSIHSCHIILRCPRGHQCRRCIRCRKYPQGSIMVGIPSFLRPVILLLHCPYLLAFGITTRTRKPRLQATIISPNFLGLKTALLYRLVLQIQSQQPNLCWPPHFRGRGRGIHRLPLMILLLVWQSFPTSFSAFLTVTDVNGLIQAHINTVDKHSVSKWFPC